MTARRSASSTSGVISVSRRGIVVALVGAMFVAGCDKGAAGGAAAPGGDRHPLLGSPAPDFDLPAQSGKSRASLADAKGKVVLVDFWATWCAPCKASFPRYQALARKHGDSVVVIGLSEDDDADGIVRFAKETGATFALAWDKDKSVASAYQPESMPTSFIVDRNGLVRFVHTGYREGDERLIDEQLTSLLK